MRTLQHFESPPHPGTDASAPREERRNRPFSLLHEINQKLYSLLQPLMVLFTWLVRPLNWLYHRWQYVRPVLFPGFLVAAVVIGFTMQQGRDVLVATAEGTLHHGALFKSSFLFASLLIFSLAAWYFARLALDAAGHHCKGANTSRVVRWLPGVLGIAPLAAATGVFVLNVKASGWLLPVGCAALAVAAPIIARRMRAKRDPRRDIGAIMPTFVTTLLVLCGVTVLFVLILPYDWARVWVPQATGTATMVLIAGAAWIAFGTAVFVQPTLRLKLVPPLLVLFLAWSLLLNYYGLNDNHTLSRDPADGRPERIAARLTPEQQLDRWLETRSSALSAAGTPYPVVVVAAEGGGIRAAYWTALVLAALEDRHPGFFCHVFAISGVSGGSLGAAVFNALIAERQARANVDCAQRADLAQVAPDRRKWNCEPDSGRLCAATQQILGRDFLAPTTAGMLFPDLVQHFLPWSVLPDRQSYLEQAWEAAWVADVDGAGEGRLAADFLDLWQDDDSDLPSLLLNTTEVARGGRAIVSNLRIEGPPRGFLDARDALVAIGRPIRVSTAAGLSARFSYVSPAANLGIEDGEGHALRLVDGGYFENSGALTALELMQASGLLTHHDGKIQPIVLTITNSTVEGLDGGSWPELLLSESLPPLDAVLHARVARGRHAETALERLMGQNHGRMIRVDLPPLTSDGSDHDAQREHCRAASGVVRAVPLSWMLAADVKRYVDCMAEPQIREVEGQLSQLLRRADS